MDILKLFAWSGLLNGIFSLGFGIFITAKDWKNRANQIFLAWTISIAFWAFSYARWLTVTNAHLAYFWSEMLNFGALWIPITFFHWVCSAFGFSKERKHVKYILILGYVITLAISLFAFTPLFVNRVEPELFFPFWPKAGILYHFFIFGLYIGLLLGYGPFLLYKKYRQTSSKEGKQIFYLFLGIVLGAGGGLTNFLLWYNIPIPPYGNFFVPLWVFFMGYGTVRYQAFGPKVITTEFLVFLIWSFSLSRIFLAAGLISILIDISLFLFVLVIGILLIGSIRREVRQRETLEKLTVDLKDLNDHLQEKVDEQTHEIKQAYEVEKKARVELEELDKAKDQFILTTQHHLRTPLTIIKGYLGVIEEDSSISDSSKTALQKVSHSTETLAKFINDLLEITELRVKEGKEIEDK